MWRRRALASVSGLLLAFVLAPSGVSAHTGAPPVPNTLWSSWSWDPPVLAGLAVAGLLYVRGLRGLWQRAGNGLGVRRWQAASYAGGLAAIFVALVTPLDALSTALFAAHMLQHLLLILVAAPLLALGAPGTVYLWALSRPSRRIVGQWWKRRRGLRVAWSWLSWPPALWALAVAALWVWHTPAFFNAALRSEPLHALEHACFLATATLFWWRLFRRGAGGRAGYGAGMLYIFTMAGQSAVLGALLTFAGSRWYTSYANHGAVWGLSPLEDQQLAGLIMWVPAGAVYLCAAAALFVLWLADAEREAASPAGRVAGQPLTSPPAPPLQGEGSLNSASCVTCTAARWDASCSCNGRGV